MWYYIIEITNKKGETTIFNGFSLEGEIYHHPYMENYFTHTKMRKIVKMLKTISWIKKVNPVRIKDVSNFYPPYVDETIKWINEANKDYIENFTENDKS